jgi:hypothetical protein
MSLHTVIDHLHEAATDLCFRSLDNLENNHDITDNDLAVACCARGWRCFLVPAENRVYVAKTGEAVGEFTAQYAEGTYIAFLY